MDVAGPTPLYRSLGIRYAAGSLAFIGLVIAVHGLSRGDAGYIEFVIGLAAFAYGATEVMWPLYVVRSDGLFVGRKGFRGLGMLIRWSSVREVTAYGQDLVVLDLFDGSQAKLQVGSLSETDRESLVAALGECSVMANKRIEPTAQAPYHAKDA